MFTLAIFLIFGVSAVFGQDPVECVQGRFGTDTGSGTYFDQSVEYYLNGNITAIQVFHSEFIHGINVAYGGVYVGLQGGNPQSSAMSQITLDAGQRITRVDIRHGLYIDQLTFYVDDVPFGPYGGYGGSLTQIPFCGHLYFKGNSGNYMDRLNIYTECTFCD